MERSFMELLFLNILIINQNCQTHRPPTIPPFQKSLSQKLHKIHPSILAFRICIIVTNKNLRETNLEELPVTLCQWGYLAILINKGFELVGKKNIKRTMNRKKTYQHRTLSIYLNIQQKQPRTIHRSNKSGTT